MAKLPTRRRIAVWMYRRAEDADEVFTRARPTKGRDEWGPLLGETLPGEHPPEAARRIVQEATGQTPAALTDLDVKHAFTVKKGPSAGEWEERLFAAEVPAGTRAVDGRWVPHYEAKAAAPEARWREGVTRMRARLGLKP